MSRCQSFSQYMSLVLRHQDNGPFHSSSKYPDASLPGRGRLRRAALMSSPWPITRLRTKNNHMQCWFVPKSKKPARRTPLTPLTSAEAAILNRRGGWRGWGRARRGRGGVCKRPCARSFSLRAPSLARCPNPFSPCTGLVQHGSFLLAAASSAADVEHLDWLDEYGTMTIVYDAVPVGIIGEPTDGPLCPPGSPCALV